MKYKNIAVFCGSSTGNNPNYEHKAKKLAERLSKEGCNLIYGAGSRGIMGIIAKTMKEHGSYVIGITPKRFEKSNKEHSLEIDECHLVKTMQERKIIMYDMADAFIIFPGGVGTLDETAEIISRKYLGFHGKPIVIYNIDGFYNGLEKLLETMAKNGFSKDMGYFKFVASLDEIIQYLENTPSFNGNHESEM